MAVELYEHPLFNDANLIGYWRLNGNSNDAKGSLNGTDTDISYSAANGVFVQGAGFNGTSSYITVGTSNTLNITGALTLFGWVKLTSINTSRNICLITRMYAGDPYSGYELGIMSTTGKPYLHVGGTYGGAGQLVADSGLSTGVWYFLAGTYNGSNAAILYLNGSSIKTGNLTNNLNRSGEACEFGTTYDRTGAPGFLNGSLDELAIFNRVLTAAEITSYYNYSSGSYFHMS